jgi:AraC-like DNA-binding protein
VQYGFEQMNFSPASLRENQQSGATQGVDFPSSLGAEKLAHRRGEMAEQLGLSLRTLHRRLAQEGLSYQLVLDNIRRSVATEFLENTHLSRRAGRFLGRH